MMMMMTMMMMLDDDDDDDACDDLTLLIGIGWNEFGWGEFAAT